MISVAVLTYNGRHYLDDCLSSLARQTHRDMEVLLVDNGSTDGTTDYVEACFPWVRVCRLDKNVGVTGGLNVCVRQARGEYVALLNNDTETDPDWLAQLHQIIASDGSIAACDSKILFFGQRGTIWSAGADYSIAGTVHPRGSMEADDTIRHPAEVFAAVGCAAIYRREVFDEIGMFDEDFFLGYEDVDWSFRARLRGYRILNAPASRVYHKVTSTIGHNSDTFVYNGQRNVLAVFIKNMPPSLLLRYWPLHLLYTLGSLAYFSREGRSRAFLRAKRDISKQWLNLWHKRQQIQRLRTALTSEIDALLSRAWLGHKFKKLQLG